MPLLMLPPELLFKILENLEFDSLTDPIPYNRDIITTIRSIASTCRLLRSLSARFIYKTLRVTCLRDLESLPSIFASHQDIGSSVRELVFGFPGDSVEAANNQPSKDLTRISIDRYRQILQSCNNIHTLYIEVGDRDSPECRLDSYGPHSDGMSALLEHINPESASRIDRLILGRFNLKKMFSHFRGLDSLSNLKTLWLLNCNGSLGNPLVSWKSGLKLFPNLPSVQDLRLELQLPTLSEEAEIALGEHIALMIPNVNTLALSTSMHCIHGALTTYAKNPSNIKELQLELPSHHRSQTTSNPSRIHLCDAISSLSYGLVSLQVCLVDRLPKSIPPLCHKTFDGKWPQLQSLGYGGYPRACNGIDSNRLLENIGRIAKTRPTAEFNIRFGTKMLYKSAGESTCHLANNEAFYNFGSDQEGLDPAVFHDYNIYDSD